MTRLYLPQAEHAPTELVLDAEQSHYLCRVLRCRRGDAVECFDGRGTAYAAAVREADPKRCRIALARVLNTRATPAVEVHLAQALVKSDLEWIVQKCTELGATDFWLVASARSETRSLRIARLERIAQSACEQSGRCFVPRLHTDLGLAEFLGRAPDVDRLMTVPGAPPLATSAAPRSTCLLVGPEGGWTDAELELGQAHGFRAVGLGDLTLRATTAGPAALAALRHGWGWRSLGL